MRKNILDWQKKIQLEMVGVTIEDKKSEELTDLGIDELIAEAIEVELYGNSDD